MQKINALELRQSLSKVMQKLKRSGEPILLEKGRRPAAVLISLEDFKRRFAEKEADERRREVQRRILGLSRKSAVRKNSEALIRELRSGRAG
ncbi:MAG: type II toxin-antitoxin system Phd/YefM family antitoxin [Deltaproteobacteria bacterium]|nr:type II toxin-antitoxin system Phd/YefM family antitoxin [Deltaproteobacteria bacterium]